MSGYEEDFSNDYDYTPKGMDDIAFHDEVVRSGLEFFWIEKYDEDRKAAEEARYYKEYVEPWEEYMGRFFPENYKGEGEMDPGPMAYLYEKAWGDVCGMECSIPPPYVEDEVLDILEHSSDEVKILYAAFVFGKGCIQRLEIRKDPDYAKEVIEADYLVALYNYILAKDRFEKSTEAVKSFMSPEQKVIEETPPDTTITDTPAPEAETDPDIPF